MKIIISLLAFAALSSIVLAQSASTISVATNISATTTSTAILTGEKSVHYQVINSVSTSSLIMTVNTLTSRDQYGCTVPENVCTLIKSTPSTRDENPFKKVEVVEKTFSDIIPNNLLGATTSLIKITSTTTIPTNAAYITPNANGTRTAYYVTDTEMQKTFRTYAVVSTSSTSTAPFVQSFTEKLTGWDLVSDATRGFSWNQDGTKLVYVSDRDGAPALYVVDTNKEIIDMKGALVTNPRYTIDSFVVHGDTAFFVANRTSKLQWGVYGVSLSEKNAKAFVVSESAAYTNNLEIVNERLVFTVYDAGSVTLRTYDVQNKKIQSFTGLPTYTVRTPMSETVNILGNTAVFTPSEKKNKQAIIWVHGGPYRQVALGRHPYASYGMFDWMLDQMNTQNVATLKIDYAGSFGYGSAYAEKVRGKVGVTDMQAVKNAITFLNKKGYTDVYVFGNSYGGYVAVKSTTEFENSIKGAIAVAPVTDWEKLVNQVSPTLFEVHFNGVPSDKNKKLYAQSDVTARASEKSAPLILIHGDKDTQVPYNQSQYAFAALSEYGAPVTFYAATGQNHVFRGVTQIEKTCDMLRDMLGVPTSTALCVLK